MIERLNPPTHFSSSIILCAPLIWKLTQREGFEWKFWNSLSLFKALSLYGVTASFSFQFQWYVPVYFTDFSFESFRPLAQDNNKSNLGAWVFYRLWQMSASSVQRRPWTENNWIHVAALLSFKTRRMDRTPHDLLLLLTVNANWANFFGFQSDWVLLFKFFHLIPTMFSLNQSPIQLDSNSVS